MTSLQKKSIRRLLRELKIIGCSSSVQRCRSFSLSVPTEILIRSLLARSDPLLNLVGSRFDYRTFFGDCFTIAPTRLTQEYTALQLRKRLTASTCRMNYWQWKRVDS